MAVNSRLASAILPHNNRIVRPGTNTSGFGASAHDAVIAAPERSLAEIAYERIKARIFDFDLLPCDRFTEAEMAEALLMSRTPAREALYRLEREGFLQVHLRVGWSVRPFDFRQFEHNYDMRLILEEASVRRLCELPERPRLGSLKDVWLVPKASASRRSKEVASLDETLHTQFAPRTAVLRSSSVARFLKEIRLCERL